MERDYKTNESMSGERLQHGQRYPLKTEKRENVQAESWWARYVFHNCTLCYSNRSMTFSYNKEQPNFVNYIKAVHILANRLQPEEAWEMYRREADGSGCSSLGVYCKQQSWAMT